METRAVVIDAQDNVATVIGHAQAGQEIPLTGETSQKSIRAASDLPFGHKLALRPIAAGEKVIKYGHSIGTAVQDISPGEAVHIHNMESDRGRGDLHRKDTA